MAGALMGVGLAAGIAIWRTRDLWLPKPEKSDTKGLLREVLPLAVRFRRVPVHVHGGHDVCEGVFHRRRDGAICGGGDLSRALLWLVLPLAAVMFPKIVHAAAKSQKSNLFNLVVLGTAVLAIGGGLGLWLVGPVVVKIVYKTSYVAATTALLPWYAAAMVPLALAERDGQRPAGARAVRGGARHGGAGGGLRPDAAGDAGSFSPASRRAANARRVQPSALRRLRVVHLGRERQNENAN